MGLTMNLLKHNVPAVIGVTKNAFSVHFARSFDFKTTTVRPEPVEGCLRDAPQNRGQGFCNNAKNWIPASAGLTN